MKEKLNIKSALIGAVLGIIVLAGIGAGGILKEGSPVADRFRLINAGHDNGHLYKIDTMTGQVWETSAESPRAEFLLPHITLVEED